MYGTIVRKVGMGDIEQNACIDDCADHDGRPKKEQTPCSNLQKTQKYLVPIRDTDNLPIQFKWCILADVGIQVGE